VTQAPLEPDAASSAKPIGLQQFFPILEWGQTYNRASLTDDLMAAVIVTIMLIPQSLAYALLAGLPRPGQRCQSKCT